MNVRRIVTGLVAAALVIGLVAADWALDSTLATSALIIFLAGAALTELYGMLGRAGIDTFGRFGVASLVLILGVRAAAAPLGLSPGEARELSLVLFAFALVGPLAIGIARPPAPDAAPGRAEMDRTFATAYALAYVGLLASFLLELRLLEGAVDPRLGLKLAFLVALAVKVGDSVAYFVGRSIGRHKMCWASPKKTWEGAIASLAGSIAVCVLAAGYLDVDVRALAGLGAVVGLAGQGGDLAESYVKRALGTKDSAKTLGEMGGALDLLDALLLAAPAGYIWVRLVIAH